MLKALSIYPFLSDESFMLVRDIANSALIIPLIITKKTNEKIFIYVTLFSLNMLLKEALESVENSLFIEESIVDVVVIDTFVVASVVSEFLFSLFLSLYYIL